MTKIKNWTIIVLFSFVLLLAWQYSSMKKKRDTERSAKERWQNNYIDQSKQHRTIVMTQKEWLKLKSDSINKLLAELKIRPKTVTKIVEKLIIQKETDTVLVEVIKIATGTYKLYDSGPCFVWQGIATVLSGDSLDVKRTGFDYQNKTTDLFYKRLKGKFLFIRWYDKKLLDQVSVSTCGGSETKTVEIRK